jgi:hypothetical protein
MSRSWGKNRLGLGAIYQGKMKADLVEGSGKRSKVRGKSGRRFRENTKSSDVYGSCPECSTELTPRIDFGVQGSMTPSEIASRAEAPIQRMETCCASFPVNGILKRQKKQGFENCVEDWGHIF